MAKDKFIIEPHFRLQEWVAEEKGYFRDEGLDYEFQELIKSTDGPTTTRATRSAPMQSFERGRGSDVSCACHWTVDVAASKGKGKLYADVYSVAPSGVFVPADSPVRKPEDLAGVPISVGYQSGSHYSTIQALEQYMPLDKIKLTFADGMLFHRARAADRRQGAGFGAVQRSVLLRRAAGLPQDHRHDLHDRIHDRRRSRPRRLAQVLPGAAACAARHRSAARALHPLLQERIPRALPRHDGYAPLGTGRAPGVRAVHARRCTRRPSSGSPTTAFSPNRHGIGLVRGVRHPGISISSWPSPAPAHAGVGLRDADALPAADPLSARDRHSRCFAEQARACAYPGSCRKLEPALLQGSRVGGNVRRVRQSRAPGALGRLIAAVFCIRRHNNARLRLIHRKTRVPKVWTRTLALLTLCLGISIVPPLEEQER